MNIQRINEGLEFFRSYADGKQPKQIVAKIQQFINKLTDTQKWPYQTAYDFINILIQSGVVINDSNIWLKLTEKGFALACGNVQPILTPQLKDFYDPQKAEQSFNHIWMIIGSDDRKTNPFYITGPEFYNVIKEYSLDLPFSCNEYLENRNNQGNSTTRNVWCKQLFLQLNKSDAINFLDVLSRIIAERQESNAKIQNSGIDPIDDIPSFDENPLNQILNNPTDMPNVRKPKIFISHNHADADYAKHLVNLLFHIGVKSEDIFCSSYPGCGVPFGKSFLDAIRGQYDQFDLLVLYIHSPRYYQSPVSLCEMGASWITQKAHLSFMTSDFEFNMLKGVVTAKEIAFHPLNRDARHRLNEFCDIIKEMFNINPMNQSIWENHRNDFIECVGKIQYEKN